MNEVQQEPQQNKEGSVFRDHRLWWLTIFAMLGAIVFFSKYSEAFPSASLDLSVPRERIAEQALEWSHKLGYNKEHTINSTTFFEDESIKTFLEFEMGTERGGELMRSEIPVWMWVSRFCKEHEAEECTVFLAPDGRFLKFKHVVPNDLALPAMTHDDAQKLASDFIQNRAKRSLDGYKLVGDETITQLKRKDYRFVWENRKVDFKGARQRYRVEVHGNQVGTFNEVLNLPEEWNRRYEKMRSYNTQLFNIANAFYNILIAVAAITFLWAVTHHNLRWKITMIFAAMFALIQVMESLNSFPTIVSQYEPVKLGYDAYIFDQILARIFATTGLFVVGVIFAGAAEVIYRMACPKRIAMENWFTSKALATTEISKGLVVGHVAPLLYLGWVITYYLLGKQIGFFTPLSVENYRALASSIVPAFSAVSLGFFASTHEEIVYRVVALNLSMMLGRKILKTTKNSAALFWLCNLLQSAAWGFMHSTYPQQPSYARGLELTFSGLLFGWIFQSFGLLPCMVTHYLIDCYLDSRVLLSSAQPMLAVTAVLAISPFFFIGLYAFNRRRFSAVKTEAAATTKTAGPDSHEILASLANEQISKLQYRPPTHESEAPRRFDYLPLSTKQRNYLLIGVFVAVILSIWSWRPAVIGQTTRLRIDRIQAEKIGDQSLRKSGLNPSDFNRVAWLSSDSVGEELQYVWEKVGSQAAVKFANLEDFGFTWTLRYFKPLQISEYRDLLDGRGVEYSMQIIEPEDASGASLTEAAATKLASDYVQRVHPEFFPLKFDSIEEIRREKRIDFRIFFESPLLKIADAPSKVQVRILGDKIAEFKQGWELPDTWKEEYERKRLRDEVTNILAMVYRLLLVVLLLWYVIGLLRSGAVRWRLSLVIGGILLLLAIANECNATLTTFQDYPTTNSIDTFISKQVMDSLQKLLWTTVFAIVPAALALAVFKVIAPETSIYAVLRVGFRPADDFERHQQRQIWRDAIVCGFGIAVLRWALSIMSNGVSSLCSPAVQASSLWAVSHLANVYSPQLDISIECVSRAIKESFNTAVFVGLYQKYVGSLRKAALVVPPLMLLQFCQERYWQDYAVVVTHSLVDWALFYFFVAKFARRNIFAYFMYGIASELLSRLPILAFHAGKVMASEIIWCVFVFILPIIWLLWLYGNKISTPAVKAES